jgi:hypothetical protein
MPVTVISLCLALGPSGMPRKIMLVPLFTFLVFQLGLVAEVMTIQIIFCLALHLLSKQASL